MLTCTFWCTRLFQILDPPMLYMPPVVLSINPSQVQAPPPTRVQKEPFSFSFQLFISAFHFSFSAFFFILFQLPPLACQIVYIGHKYFDLSRLAICTSTSCSRCICTDLSSQLSLITLITPIFRTLNPCVEKFNSLMMISKKN